MASMNGIDAKTELTGKTCNGHVSAEWNGHLSRSVYVCMKCGGVWPWSANMGPDTPHKEVGWSEPQPMS
jgi:hypothetical protein